MFGTVRKITRIRGKLFNASPVQKTCINRPKQFSSFVHHDLGYNCSNSNNSSVVKQLQRIPFSSQVSKPNNEELDSITFDKISNETLESLSDYFDELMEAAIHLVDADVSNRDGVLTVKFGEKHGTYVINRQTPNKQIWLSSPRSGPKRYDFVNAKWVYKRDGRSLHELLNEEIPSITKSKVVFEKCSHSGMESDKKT